MEPAETIDALTRTLAGVDGARRVGWAKYYQTDAQLEADRKTLIAHLGVVVGITEILLPSSTENRTAIVNDLHDFAEGVISEAHEFSAYRLGLQRASREYTAWFGKIEAEKGDGSQRRPGTISTQGAEFLARCGDCQRVIAKVTSGTGAFEAKCSRCGKINQVEW